ncbi:hypothetical protein AGMMS49940_17550 [Spirochaetia bacterium]|nr:hypothetical protein AGMMS49940_17550 [Spirochaetia bacterium]
MTSTADAAAGYALTAGSFSSVRYVTSDADSGAGTLRQAITNAVDGDTIQVALPKGSVIRLESRLTVDKNLTIAGNGVTLTRAASWATVDGNSQLLYVNGSGITANISRVHFKDGRAAANGAAVRINSGTLNLESCIFSGNQTNTSGVGGAIYSGGTLTVKGCTFYGNSAGNGGAIYGSTGPLTLTGNLFYGNTAPPGYPVVRNSGTVTSGGYNVVDVDFGTGTAQSGWASVTGDATIGVLPISPGSFKLLSGSGAAGVINPLPGNYPTVDFYGDAITAGAAAGAVQASTGSGYYLGLSVNNSAWGSVSVLETPDTDGLFIGSVTITATPTVTGSSFDYWLKDGLNAGTTTSLTFTLSASTTVEAVFAVVSVGVNGISYSDVLGGTWTLEGDGRYKSPATGSNAITKARVSFTSTADAAIVIQLDVSSEYIYDGAFISTLDNASATYNSGYYPGSKISGYSPSHTTTATIVIPVPTAGSHFVEIGFERDSSGSGGSNCAWFKVIE